ncbi:coiled-coil-helix-coiled-coil-helix domain-containing protein 1 [Ischnura elegans]|uniref:coiled-coil-helix-coiled-coil-helix domain-containing protein 1 n=1 Tax=Ischnura elegans TaxID=197161 RepID=UPI001ED883B7|nr:coiled-coil-helix-coiled-coil-helix domain-containing protein 1 [Ischnura elegans]XP_046408032.1 coiled-coil-helix-coiled-coil-helix domain-containing protein 1 [Ischnura elegans]
MRLYQPLCKWPQRKPVYPRETFKFQELLPLKLKPTVSGKGEKSSDVACLQEMSILFACFKKNEFNQALCSNEIQNFNKCYKNFMDTKHRREEMDRRGELTPGAKKLSHKQINQLMKRFPT